MTDPKDKSGNTEQEWEFTAVKLKDKLEKGPTTQSPAGSKVKGPKKIIRKEPGLVLDEASVPRSRTRSAMAQELKSNKEEEDAYEYAPFFKRAIAFVFDAFFWAGLGFLVKISSPIYRQIIQLFLDKYKLKFLLPEPVVMQGLVGINGLLIFFFLVIVPLSFFNLSLGKKIMGLRVRGVNKYTISLSQAFKRELVKPVSILIIAGLVTPFFSKKHQSIHDMVADTIVIEE